MRPISITKYAQGLRTPQGVWTDADDPHFQRCVFGGQEMLLVSVGDEHLTYDLMYMSFKMTGFHNLEEAKENAQAFALKVLKLIAESAATLEPIQLSVERALDPEAPFPG
ncbi:hypothetical protein RBE51_20725 [Pseudomonas taiwanensis]|uniref:hypothetical protein n=1 Tax=Pseudomonas taiwanensis TaxID=470150 RepID=UPI0028DFFD7A|nr:hypothetical protein [Pseudomonas taiwanensis]MDT8925221.1 hypothetical protein [Pseudomonas taiwanensis]